MLSAFAAWTDNWQIFQILIWNFQFITFTNPKFGNYFTFWVFWACDLYISSSFFSFIIFSFNLKNFQLGV
jgi:hypothetical protein